MSVLDKAKTHFVGLVNGDTLHQLQVTEWDEAIHFRPVAAMNGAQYQAFYEAASKQDFEGMVDLLILRARYEDGRKMFRPSDKAVLMKEVSPQVVTDIVRRMSEVDNAAEDDVKK